MRLEPRAPTMVFAICCAFPAATSSDMYQKTRSEGSSRNCAARDDRTYVPRRLFPPTPTICGAQKGAHADQRDFEDCFARGIHDNPDARRHRLPSLARKGQAVRARCISRRVHGDFGHGRLPGMGCRRIGRPQGLAARAATDRGRPFDEEMLFSLGHVIEDAGPAASRLFSRGEVVVELRKARLTPPNSSIVSRRAQPATGPERCASAALGGGARQGTTGRSAQDRHGRGRQGLRLGACLSAPSRRRPEKARYWYSMPASYGGSGRSRPNTRPLRDSFIPQSIAAASAPGLPLWL